MTTLIIASLMPDRMNIHADAENAQALRARASWQGVAADVVDVHTPADADGLQPDAVIIGSGFDADAREVLDVLEPIGDRLLAWSEADIPFLAVGLGWDLLSRSVELEPAVPTTGIGVFRGRSVSAERRVGTLATRTQPWGVLVGYEYHLRDNLLGDGEEPWGEVLSGCGNVGGPGPSAGEGAMRGNLLATGMRGPVLARNPALADDVLARMCSRRSVAHHAAGDDRQRLADEHAHRANDIVLADMRVGRGDESPRPTR